MIKPMSQRSDWNRLPVDNPARKVRERARSFLLWTIIAGIFMSGVLVGWGAAHAHWR